MKFRRSIVIILLLFITIGLFIPIYVNAATDLVGIGDLDKYKLNGSNPTTYFNGMINSIVFVIRTIASIISVVVLIVIGIKYMIGSIEEKAEYKKTMVPYLIGSILVFGITNILGVIYNVAINLNK